MLERLIASQNLATVRIDSDLPTLVDLLPKQAKTRRKVLQAVERLVGPRRQELVQFNFRDLSVADEFDQASITYALRELNRAGGVHLRAAVPRPGDPHDPPRSALRRAGDRLSRPSSGERPWNREAQPRD